MIALAQQVWHGAPTLFNSGESDAGWSLHMRSFPCIPERLSKAEAEQWLDWLECNAVPADVTVRKDGKFQIRPRASTSHCAREPVSTERFKTELPV
jgi:hypothetical protein